MRTSTASCPVVANLVARLVAACLVVAGPGLLCGSAQAAEIRQISLRTKDLIYNPGDGMIYASIPGSAGGIGNSLVAINPANGSVGSPVFIGSEPGRLAISDDGHYLYVSLDGAAAIRRFDFLTQTPDIQFTLGSDPFFGPYYVEDLEVLPGAPGTIAVSRKNLGISPRHAGVAIYDDGVQRPITTQRHTGSNVIEPSASASILYGYNNETTEFGFRRLAVTSSGVTEVSVASNLISGFGVNIEYDNGRVYSTTGRVVDPETFAIVGTYSGLDFFVSAVRPDSTRGLTYFLSGSVLSTYNQATFTRVESLGISGVQGNGTSLIRWGDDGLAFRTDADQVFLVRTAAGATNDDFASAFVIGSLPFTDSQNTALATTEAGEPAPCGSIGRTLWYSFTPAQDTMVTADTSGSGFDTVLAAYTGSALADLAPLGCNDNTAGTTSRLSILARAGATIYLQVGGAAGASGNLSLGVTGTPPPPPNDDFANARPIEALPFADSLDTTGATSEEGESAPCAPIGHTVWYAIAPDADLLVTVSTAGSSFGTVIGAYAGDFLGSLVTLGCASSFTGDGNRLVFTARRGTTARIQIGGFSDQAGLLAVSIEARPALTIGVTLDRTGSFDSRTGAAIIHGAVTCSRPILVDLGVALQQKVGRFRILQGQTFTSVSCSSETRWSATVFSPDGAFAGGPALASAIASAFDTTTNESAQAQASAEVQLHSGRRPR